MKLQAQFFKAVIQYEMAGWMAARQNDLPLK
jgi:hypothetical protein